MTESEAPQAPDIDPGVLDLDEAEASRPQVRIKGQLYFLKTANEFSMRESARIRRLVKQMQKRLDVIDDLDVEEHDDTYKLALDILDAEAEKLLDLVLPIPTNVRATLETSQKMRILSFFTVQSYQNSSTSVMSAITPRE